MKRFVKIVVVLLLLCVVFMGCTKGSYNVVNCVKKNTSTSMSMSYDKFDGYIEREIKIKEPVTMEITITSESGELNLYVAKDNDKAKAIFNKTDVNTETFIIDIKETGTYTIRADGNNHKGSFELVWE